MSEIEKKWYVLRAVSGKENKVKEYLDADIKHGNLGDYVSQVLIPTEKTYQVRNGKKIVKERTYLPGYVLVEAALVGEVAHHLRNTPNVIGFLGGLDHPVPLRQSEVNRILGTVDELQESGEDLNIPYTVGETVKVSVGPFSGFSGLIEEVNAEKRWAVNLKYSYKDRFIIQGKWGITCYNDRDKISSGTEEIQGNRKADLQLQLKVKW